MTVEAYHELGNDLWISTLVFPRKRGGYFVELGAWDGRVESSCFILERDLGLSGICVEPYSSAFSALGGNRPKSVCVQLCLHHTDEPVTFVEVPFGTGSHPMKSGVLETLRKDRPWDCEETIAAGTQVQRTGITIRTLLERHRAPPVIDYLSIDIEAGEIELLQSFPWDRYSLRALSIEVSRALESPIPGMKEVFNPYNRSADWERYFVADDLFEEVRRRSEAVADTTFTLLR